MVTLIKQFIQAERMGNWQLHLQCIQQMLPYFHASGHFLYAKSCQLYLQDMLDLKSKLSPLEYDRFVTNGYFTIRRSDKFWSGIWADMTIEQTLMRSMKSAGGLTRGQGITDSVLTKWILAMPILLDIKDKIEEFCHIAFVTSEQTLYDARLWRISRDNRDVEKFMGWFSHHPPFPVVNDIMLISTGVKGDVKIDCHNAYEIGMSLMTQIVGNNFSQIKFQRKKRVVPLRAANSSIKIQDEIVPIDPNILFQRISLAKKSDQHLQQYLQYELALFLLSLFNVSGMRKTKKSDLYEAFSSVTDVINFGNFVHVIDGGYLLHRIAWRQQETFAQILDKYVDYVKKYYKSNSFVIFDGYPDEARLQSTKSAERLRRSNIHVSASVLFNESMIATMPQEKFLSNEKNKDRLISMLCEKLQTAGFIIKQAVEDADTLIINTAIDALKDYDSVVIVGEDVDLLVILTALASSKSSIYFMKPSKGKTDQKIYSSTSFQYPDIADHILFLHAFTGCDTTSTFFRQGKIKFIKLFQRDDNLQNISKCFGDPDAHPDFIDITGQKCILAL